MTSVLGSTELAGELVSKNKLDERIEADILILTLTSTCACPHIYKKQTKINKQKHNKKKSTEIQDFFVPDLLFMVGTKEKLFLLKCV